MKPIPIEFRDSRMYLSYDPCNLDYANWYLVDEEGLICALGYGWANWAVVF